MEELWSGRLCAWWRTARLPEPNYKGLTLPGRASHDRAFLQSGPITDRSGKKGIMNPQHTGGSWKMGTSFEEDGIGITAENGTLIAIVQADDTESFDSDAQDEAKANARLIAAAPDLLEALDQFLNIDDWNDELIASRELVNKAFSAVKKARGE